MKLDKVAWLNRFTLGVIDDKKKNEDLVYNRKYISLHSTLLFICSNTYIHKLYLELMFVYRFIF